MVEERGRRPFKSAGVLEKLRLDFRENGGARGNMDWFEPNPKLLRQARFRYLWAAGWLLFVAAAVPAMVYFHEGYVAPWELLPNCWVVSLGLLLGLRVRRLRFSLAVDGERLWIKSPRGQIWSVPQSTILTNGKSLLAGSRWIALGVQPARREPWKPFYSRKLLASFPEVGTLRLFYIALKRGSLSSWFQLLIVLSGISLVVLSRVIRTW